MHILTALISNKALLKPTKTRHQWTPELIKSMKIFGVRRVNQTKIIGAHLQCGRNGNIYHNFFVWTDFVSQWILRQNYSLVNLAGNGECNNKPNPIFVACFSPKVWLIV